MAKKNLQDRISGISDYFKGIEMYNGALIVKVIFPKKWNVTNSYDGTIKVAQSDSVPTEYYYYGDSAMSTYDDIFDLIEETVSANESALLKLELLKRKVEELKELFSKEEMTYEKLEQLEFTFKAKPKQKAKKKKENKEGEVGEETPEVKKEEESKDDVMV